LARTALVDLCALHPWEAARFVAGADFSIGNRLHLALLSLATMTPVFSICLEGGGDRLQFVHQQFGSTDLATANDISTEQMLAFGERVLSGRERAGFHERVSAALNAHRRIKTESYDAFFSG
jgi:polysaccharide pyruvyl transferase WcaK-like protein